LRKKGSNAYSDLIDPVVKFLVNKGFVKRAVNTAEIMITEEGVNMCNRESPTGWYFQDYPID
jgi:predicted transcriptional regulator